MTERRAPTCTFQASTEDPDTLVARLSGDWKVGTATPSAADAHREIDHHAAAKRIRFEADELGAWDSTLLTFLRALSDHAATQGKEIARGDLPEGVERLMNLAAA